MYVKAFLLLVTLPVAAAIVGGTPLPSINSIPWQALVNINTGNPFMPVSPCGGTIIASQWVLTAAHCVQGKRESDLTVYTGKYNRLTPELTQQGYFVKKIFLFNWDPCNMLNDVALLQLTADIVFDEFSQRINMAVPGEETTLNIFSQCTLTGWGSEVYNGMPNTLLEYLNVVPVDRLTCAAELDRSLTMVTGLPAPTPLTDQHICVTGLPTTGACTGDSGGPLTCQRTYVDPLTGMPTLTETVLVGVTSRGSFACGDAPTVYTSVSHFYNLIWNTINTQTTQNPPLLPGQSPPLPPINTLPVPECPQQPMSSYPMPSYPMPPYPMPSYPMPSYPMPSYPMPSLPMPSYPMPSYPMPSYPMPSYPMPSYPFPQPSYPFPQPSYPFPQPSYPFPQPSYPFPQPSYPFPQPSYPFPQPSYPSYPAPPMYPWQG